MTKAERNELADMLTVMIEQGQGVMSFNPVLKEKAMEFYLKYRASRPAEEFDPVLRAEADRRERERRRDLVTVCLRRNHAHRTGPGRRCRRDEHRGWEQGDCASEYGG